MHRCIGIVIGFDLAHEPAPQSLRLRLPRLHQLSGPQGCHPGYGSSTLHRLRLLFPPAIPSPDLAESTESCRICFPNSTSACRRIYPHQALQAASFICGRGLRAPTRHTVRTSSRCRTVAPPRSRSSPKDCRGLRHEHPSGRHPRQGIFLYHATSVVLGDCR
jgi:hypothetical protein